MGGSKAIEREIENLKRELEHKRGEQAGNLTTASNLQNDKQKETNDVHKNMERDLQRIETKYRSKILENERYKKNIETRVEELMRQIQTKQAELQRAVENEQKRAALS